MARWQPRHQLEPKRLSLNQGADSRMVLDPLMDNLRAQKKGSLVVETDTSDGRDA